MRFSPNGKFLLLSSLDSTIRLWDWNLQQCVKTLQGHLNTKYSVSATMFDAASGAKCVASASEDHKVVVWNLQSKIIQQTLSGHEGVVMAVAAHSTRPLLASCGFDCTVRVWSDEATM